MDSNPNTVGEILLWVGIAQGVLYWIARALEKVMDKTTTTADNKAHWFFSRALTILDMFTGNREHK